MAINVKCVCCEEPLTKPGAIMLGPPRDLALGTSEVLKHHVCVDCWKWVMLIVSDRPRPTPNSTQEEASDE